MFTCGTVKACQDSASAFGFCTSAFSTRCKPYSIPQHGKACQILFISPSWTPTPHPFHATMGTVIAGPATPTLTTEGSEHYVPPILRLPTRLRLRLYFKMCILGSPKVHNRFINLNNQGARNRDYDGFLEGFSFTLAHRLMLTCRTFYNEVCPIVYARNHLFIRFSDRGNLEALRRLSPTALRAIRLLTIHLNVASCGLGSPCHYYLRPGEKPAYDNYRCEKPLDISNPFTKVRRIGAAWQVTSR